MLASWRGRADDRPGRQPPRRNCSPTNCGCSAPTTPTPWPPATTWHRGEAGPATRPGQPTEPVALSSLARPGAGPTIESPTVPHAPTFSAPPTPCCSAPPRPRAPPCSGHVQATVPTPPARASPDVIPHYEVPHTCCICGATYRCDDESGVRWKGSGPWTVPIECVGFSCIPSPSRPVCGVRLVREERPSPVARPRSSVVLSDVPEQGVAGQPRA